MSMQVLQCSVTEATAISLFPFASPMNGMSWSDVCESTATFDFISSMTFSAASKPTCSDGFPFEPSALAPRNVPLEVLHSISIEEPIEFAAGLWVICSVISAPVNFERTFFAAIACFVETSLGRDEHWEKIEIDSIEPCSVSFKLFKGSLDFEDLKKIEPLPFG